ncbi:MAG: ABC transporter permease subunit [Bdellovibrionales bacterium]|nr:ABC transporter permease subunit [Bdellovibrionales bacterium]
MSPNHESGRGLPRHLERRVRHSLLYLALIAGALLVSAALYQGGVRLAELTAERVTVAELPYALTLSLLRIAVAFVASLAFSFLIGVLAARNAAAETIVVPTLDVLQSIPIVGFFPAAITLFIGIGQGGRIGVELAAVFLIFTSQAWNIAFAVYEAVKRLPPDRIDAMASLGVTGSRRFWVLYVPAAIPRVVSNSVLSWANGWFFLVACEIIAVGPMKYHLPGIGSFLAKAAEQDQGRLVMIGLAALTLLILTFDLVLWRPLAAWAEKFRSDSGPLSEHDTSASAGPVYRGLASLAAPFAAPLRQLARALFHPLLWLLREVISPLLWDLPVAILNAAAHELNRHFFARIAVAIHEARRNQPRLVALAWALPLMFFLAWAAWAGARWFRGPLPSIAREIPLALLASTGRLVLALLISLAWVLPVCLWVWDRPRLRQGLGTLAQVGASLPAVALFPLIILVMVRRFGGGMEAASILLLMTGMQWYLLFNGLGGATSIPFSLHESTRSFGLSRVSTWRRLVIPAMQPSLLTGAITAWGGGWNALVVSEYVTYREEVLTVNGIGALLNRSVYQSGDSRAIVLCIVAMVGWILLLNTVFWRPVIRSSLERYRIET